MDWFQVKTAQTLQITVLFWLKISWNQPAVGSRTHGLCLITFDPRVIVTLFERATKLFSPTFGFFWFVPSQSLILWTVVGIISCHCTRMNSLAICTGCPTSSMERCSEQNLDYCYSSNSRLEIKRELLTQLHTSISPVAFQPFMYPGHFFSLAVQSTFLGELIPYSILFGRSSLRKTIIQI